MDIRNCKSCGAMFQYVGDPVCPKCHEALELKLAEVKDYLKEHEFATVAEVSEEVDVAVKQLHRWVREERLMFAPGVDTGMVCSKCGVPIPSGSMCSKCKEQLKNAFSQANRKEGHYVEQRSTSQSSKERMHLSRYK